MAISPADLNAAIQAAQTASSKSAGYARTARENADLTQRLYDIFLRESTKWRGDWDGATVYVTNDMIQYGGSSYICVKQNFGHAPGDTTYWNLVAQGAGGSATVSVVAPLAGDGSVGNPLSMPAATPENDGYMTGDFAGVITSIYEFLLGTVSPLFNGEGGLQIQPATDSQDGYMAAADKSKLDGIPGLVVEARFVGDLPDRDATISPAGDLASLYRIPTITGNWGLTLEVTPLPPDKLIIQIVRTDLGANTYDIKDDTGTIIFTFQGSVSVSQGASFYFDADSAHFKYLSTYYVA